MLTQRARGRLILLLALLLVAPALPVSAAEISTTCADLQAALDAASNGDVITITEANCASTSYTMKTGTEITLQGAPGTGTTFTDGAPGTRILSGFDVGASALRDLTFRESVIAENGGGVALTGTVTPLFERVSFIDNQGLDGGGLFITSTAATGSIRIVNALFEGNVAPDDGGGAFIVATAGAAVEVEGTTFHENRALENGGGAYFVGQDMDLGANVFTSNQAGQQGGGAWLVVNHGEASLERNTFSENLVMPEGAVLGSAYYGGGLYLSPTSGSDVSQFRNLFDSNEIRIPSIVVIIIVGVGGAGEYITQSPNFAVEPPEIFINRDRFVNNAATTMAGVDIRGVGLGLAGVDAEYWNMVAAGNEAFGGSARGSGVYAGNTVLPQTHTMHNSTISGNTAVTGTAGFASDDTYSLEVRNSIIAGNSGTTPDVFGFAIVDAQHTDACAGVGFTGGPLPGTGNICADPLLVNPAPGPADVHQTAASPTRDAGSNALVPAALTTDYEGDPRIMDSNADGVEVVDMGADEILQALVIQPAAPQPPPLQPAAVVGGRIPATGPEDIMPHSFLAASYLLLGLLLLRVTTPKWSAAWRAASYSARHGRGRSGRYEPRHRR